MEWADCTGIEWMNTNKNEQTNGINSRPRTFLSWQDSCIEIWINVQLQQCSENADLLLQLQLDLRTPMQLKAPAQEQLQERAAGGSCSSTWLLQPPALLAEGWGGVQPGQTRCTTTGRQSWNPPSQSLSPHRLKVSRSGKVFTSGLLRLLQCQGCCSQRKVASSEEKTTLHFCCFIGLAASVNWCPTPRTRLFDREI